MQANNLLVRGDAVFNGRVFGLKFSDSEWKSKLIGSSGQYYKIGSVDIGSDCASFSGVYNVNIISSTDTNLGNIQVRFSIVRGVGMSAQILGYTTTIKNKFSFIIQSSGTVYTLWIKVDYANVLCAFGIINEAYRSSAGNDIGVVSININDEDSWVSTAPTGTTVSGVKTGLVPYAETSDVAGKLATPRNINLTGAITGTASFDGSQDIELQTTVNHTHAYLPLDGGIITGDIKRKIGNLTKAPIMIYEGDANGAGMVIEMGGRTIIGSGESASALRSALGGSDANEEMYITSDQSITFYTNCQTIANRKSVTIDMTGKVTASGGFSGNLTGNASSATKASNMVATNLGSFNGKTVSAFKTAIKNWWAKSTNELYFMAYFTGDDSWVNNFATDTATLTGGSLWQVTPIGGSAQNGTYGAFLVSSYGQPVYLLEYKNGTFITPVRIITSGDVGSLTVSTANYLNAVHIPTNANLNSYTTTGFYFCPDNATVATFTNSPTSRAFFMIVGKHAGTSQTVIEYMTSGFRIYHRNLYNGTWGGWIRLYTTIDKPTASEIGAADSNHTHNYAGSSSAGGSATSAVKLETARTINVNGGVSGTATEFDGSANINIPVTSIREAYLIWGGRNFAGGYGPIDAAMVPELGANRLAFMPATGVEIQYSTNGGSSWSTYSVSEAAKLNLFNGIGTSLNIGASTATGIDKSKYQLRIIITTNTANVYTALNKFCIYCSTNGSTGSWCTIDAKSKANVDSGTDTWVTFASKVSLSGWSGYNIINTNDITTYGNQTYHYQKLRFTFGVTSHASSVTYNGLTIMSIMGFGGMGWTTPSTMAKYGRMYTYDYLKNVTFPNGVSAAAFYGNASSASKLQTARSITLSGSVTGSASFDGSDNVTISTTTNHTHSYVPLSGGTLTGQLIAQANTAYTTAQVRNITMSTAEPSGGVNGQIHFKYT